MGFVGLYIGASGIRAAQTGLDTASNNIANANTPGYTRQRVELSPSHTFPSRSGPVGTGVTVDAISRLRDHFLDARYRAAIGRGAEDAVRAESLQSMENLSGEPDQGVSARVGQLWGVFEGWSNTPDSDAARTEVLGTMQLIAEGFRSTSDSWVRLGEDTEERLAIAVDTANALLSDLTDLNARLTNVPDERIGPQLADQRDLIIDQIAELTGASARIQPNGSVRITAADGQTVLASFDDDNGRGFRTLRLDPDTGALQVSGELARELAGDDADYDEATEAFSGELRGLERTLAEDLPRWLGELDDVARLLTGALNRVNGEGFRRDGERGGNLLVFDELDPARTLRLADGVAEDRDSLAAAWRDDGFEPEGGWAPEPNDGTNARRFAELRSERLDADGDPAEGGRSIENRLSDVIVGLATEVNSARTRADAAVGIAAGAGLARAAEHGVSIDEEMVDLIRYQRALEASARVMTTVDQALDVLINRVGIVGR